MLGWQHLIAGALEAGWRGASFWNETFLSGKRCVLHAAWGDGYEKFIVFGKHRGAHGLVQMVVQSKAITHWRAQVVYSPSLLAKLEESSYYSWRDEAEVRHWAAMLQERDQ